jgi:hypothetical protein
LDSARQRAVRFLNTKTAGLVSCRDATFLCWSPFRCPSAPWPGSNCAPVKAQVTCEILRQVQLRPFEEFLGSKFELAWVCQLHTPHRIVQEKFLVCLFLKMLLCGTLGATPKAQSGAYQERDPVWCPMEVPMEVLRNVHSAP